MSLRGRFLVVVAASVIGVVSTLAGAPTQALATPPEIFRFPVEDRGVLQPESRVCGFPIMLEESGEIRVHVHYDAEGSPIRINVWGHSTGVLSANGIQVRVFKNDHKFFDLRNQTVTSSGVFFRWSAPGLGVVLMDRGRLVWNSDGDLIFEAGQQPGGHGEFDVICAVLTP